MKEHKELESAQSYRDRGLTEVAASQVGYELVETMAGGP